jgi:hypothetical protein
MQSMTASEVRDRLGDRFRLLVGSRRGLERHQTLRHAVAWSYDLLDDGERSVLNQCSVFAGGFDLAGAQAVTGSDDDIATLDLLDALVRKSLMVADHSSGHTRFTMLETISRVQRGRDTHTVSRTWLIMSLTVAPSYEEAIAATTGLIEAAEATGNPWVLSFALFGFGAALTHADPVGALQACRRGLQVAEDSGNRGNGTYQAMIAARIEAEYGDSRRALHYIAVAIHNYHDSGAPMTMRAPMAILATVLDRMGRYEPAATIAGFASTPFTVATVPELLTTTAHLRTALGDQDYESLARKGEAMTPAEIATYAYDQIDQARTELEQPS